MSDLSLATTTLSDFRLKCAEGPGSWWYGIDRARQHQFTPLNLEKTR